MGLGLYPTSPDPMEEAWNWYSLKLNKDSSLFPLYWFEPEFLSHAFPLFFHCIDNCAEKFTLEFHALSTMFNDILFPSLFQPFLSNKCNSKVWKINGLHSFFADPSQTMSLVYIMHFCKNYIFLLVLLSSA